MSKTTEIEKSRGKNGQFLPGVSGNPSGRPKGSKNVITTQKLIVEEAFRESQGADIQKVLALIVKQAMSGCKASQKLIWDSAVSKQTLAEDKTQGNRQEIHVRTMNVSRGDVIEGEIVDEEEIQDEQEV